MRAASTSFKSCPREGHPTALGRCAQPVRVSSLAPVRGHPNVSMEYSFPYSTFQVVPPEGRRRGAPAQPPAGASPSRKQQTRAFHRQLPRLPGSGAEPSRRDVVANQIFPQNVDKICLQSRAAANLSGGGDSQEGAKRPLLCARRAQRQRFPAREIWAHLLPIACPCGKNIPTAACV